MKSGELRGARVHPQEATAKINNAPVGVGEELRFDLVKTAPAASDDAGVAQNGEMFRNLSLSSFARLLRWRGCGKSKPPFPDKHQITDVYQRVRKIGQDADRVAFERP
jgi:hypothetical protein